MTSRRECNELEWMRSAAALRAVLSSLRTAGPDAGADWRHEREAEMAPNTPVAKLTSQSKAATSPLASFARQASS